MIYILQEKPDTHDTYTPMIGHTRQPFIVTQYSLIDSLLPGKSTPGTISSPTDQFMGSNPLSFT
jgi:hypothetical protein